MDDQKESFYLVLKRSGLVILIPILVFVIEFLFEENFYWLGVYPRKIEGLPGIFTSPLKHGDIAHLLGNVMLISPLLIGLFIQFKRHSFKTLFLISVITNIWLWIGGRESWHIGASGVVYGLFFYLLFIAYRLKIKELALYPLIVLFLSAGFWIGLLPIQIGVSVESHLLGSIAGVLVALFQRKPDINGGKDMGSENSTINISYNYIYTGKSTE